MTNQASTTDQTVTSMGTTTTTSTGTPNGGLVFPNSGGVVYMPYVPQGTTGQVQPTELPSSKDLRQQLDPDEFNRQDWKAKYDGMVGSARSRIAQLTNELEARDLKIAELADSLNAAVSKIKELEPSAGRLSELEGTLKNTQAELDTHRQLTSRQQLALKFPQLAAIKNEQGQMPMVEMLLSSKLPDDQLEQYATQLSASFAQPVSRATASGMAVPGLPSQSSSTESPASIRAKALEAHSRFIQSGGRDMAARDEEQKYWAQAKEAERISK